MNITIGLYIYISESPLYCVFLFLSEFFRKHNVAVMTVKELFNFITDPTVNEDNMDEYLDAMDEKKQKTDKESDLQQQVEEQVFKQAYIPQSLTQVSFIIAMHNRVHNLYLETDKFFIGVV